MCFLLGAELGRAALRCSLCPPCAPPAPGAAPLGTARSWRDIVSVTPLAREGRMTVTIGRRELLAALGGAAVARPLTARAQLQPGKLPTIGYLGAGTSASESQRVAAFKERLH